MERYRKIIPNYDEFERTMKRPMPNDIRVNTIKSSMEEVVTFLKNEGMKYIERKWNDCFFKTESNPSKTLFHWMGKYYIQQSVSGIPPLALNPKPNEKILDMCAAPGSKTTQISMMMENRGEILANDVRPIRTRGLLSNTYRTGCLNVQVMERDGRNLPETPKFDRVLVDVPCSAEGDSRSIDKNDSTTDSIQRNDLVDLQSHLLRKAFRMCKVGGVVVYSTCTFAPEENELVVSKFLDKGRLEDPKFNFPHSTGITEWKSETLNRDLGKCVRVYPHQLDSGGIFLAKFRKKA